MNTAHKGTFSIYQGGDTEPEELLRQQQYEMTGEAVFQEFELNEPLPLDFSRSLWVVMSSKEGSSQYPASCTYNMGVANNRWFYNGAYWDDIANYDDSSWLIRAFVGENTTACSELGESIDVYPNPTQGFVNIVATGLQSVRLFNAVGQEVYDTETHGNQVSINVSNLSDGIYFMRILTVQGASVRCVEVAR